MGKELGVPGGEINKSHLPKDGTCRAKIIRVWGEEQEITQCM